jgi:hypothetical protein
VGYKYFAGYASWLTENSSSELVESWGVRLAILRLAIGLEFKLLPFSAAFNLDVSKHNRAAGFHDLAGPTA